MTECIHDGCSDHRIRRISVNVVYATKECDLIANKVSPWKHDSKFKSTCPFVANKMFEDILLNATTVNAAMESYFNPQIKGKLNQFSEFFAPKYTPPTKKGSFQNKNYQLSVISYDYFIEFINSNCFNI